MKNPWSKCKHLCFGINNYYIYFVSLKKYIIFAALNLNLTIEKPNDTILSAKHHVAGIPFCQFPSCI